MQTQTLLVGLLFLLAALGIIAYVASMQSSLAPVGCTLEAKLCPDGSAVGRTGPNCEFAACPEATSTGNGTGGGGILPYASGIRGIVMLGPTCPVMRDPPDPECNDRPFQTSITVSRASTPAQIFVLSQSAPDGTFEVSLPPGDYLVGAGGEAILPYCAQTPATVAPSGYTQIMISCDSGIR